MPLLLSLETSTSYFSVALHHNKKLIGFEEITTPQSTASQLAVVIQRIMQESGHHPNQLNAVVVASGPGSYTGLRIGVATAKGICFALQLPLIAVNTLEVMAYQAKNMLYPSSAEDALANDVLLCPMLDARRMEVYCLIADQQLQLVEPTQAKIIDPLSFAELLDRKAICFFGEGADKCKTVITHVNARFIEGIKPSAGALGEMGLRKFKNAQFENLGTFEPFYLKDFVIRKPNLV